MKKINTLILGGNGLVGRTLSNNLQNSDKVREVIASTREDANLFSLEETRDLIKRIQPDLIINAAAKVGGIQANNTQRTEFIIENLKINMNLFEAVIDFPSTHIINLGSSCIYPLDAPNPISENSFLSGSLEPTNSPYAMAKITGIEIGRSVMKQYGTKVTNLMPTNLYGPFDKFSELDSHVIPGLIHRMHTAKVNGESEFLIWGTGEPLREFLYSEDLAEAIEFIIDKDFEDDLLNIGSGEEIKIKDLSMLIKEIIDYDGKVLFDTSKPDGNPRKLLDSSRIKSLGWNSKTKLSDGLSKTYEWYLSNII